MTWAKRVASTLMPLQQVCVCVYVGAAFHGDDAGFVADAHIGTIIHFPDRRRISVQAITVGDMTIFTEHVAEC